MRPTLQIEPDTVLFRPVKHGKRVRLCVKYPFVQFDRVFSQEHEIKVLQSGQTEVIANSISPRQITYVSARK